LTAKGGNSLTVEKLMKGGGGEYKTRLGHARSRVTLADEVGFVASPPSQSARQRDPRVAFVIGWDEETVQFQGLADEPTGAELPVRSRPLVVTNRGRFGASPFVGSTSTRPESKSRSVSIFHRRLSEPTPSSRAERGNVPAAARRAWPSLCSLGRAVKNPVAALVLLAAGCATGSSFDHRESGPYGRYHACCDCRPSAADAVLGVLTAVESLVKMADAAAALAEPRPSPPAQMPKPLVGTVRLPDAGGVVPQVAVVLEGATGLIQLRAITDERGRFWFPLPLPADSYRISLDDERFDASIRVWLKERRRDVDLVAQPKPTEPASSD